MPTSSPSNQETTLKRLATILAAVVMALSFSAPSAFAWDSASLRVQYNRARANGWSRILKNVEHKNGLPKGMLFGVASRETLMSNVVADNGHGRGLFQIDDRYHQDWLAAHGAGRPGQVPPVKDAAQYAARILSAHHERAVREHRHHPWKFALCAYNRGYAGASRGVEDGGTCEFYTADIDSDGHGDYASDVQARVRIFRDLLAERHVPKPTVHRPHIQLDARHLVSSHGWHTPTRIVLHSTESPNYMGTRDLYGIARYWHENGRGLGAQLTVDGDGLTALNIDLYRIGWHVAGRNTGSIGIEQVGYARYTRAQWLAHPKQLEKVAKWIAYCSAIYGIPIRHAYDHGVSTHRDQTIYAHVYGGHTDPGSGYPFDIVLKLAKKYKKTGW